MADLKSVSPERAAELIRAGAVLVDVRDADEYARERIPGALSVYILPPSRDTLESRLRGCNQDGAEVIGERMRQAVSEMSHWDESDYLVVNDRFEVALADLQGILRANRLRRPAQGTRLSGLIRELLSAP